jgi:hypothetical protein
MRQQQKKHQEDSRDRQDDLQGWAPDNFQGSLCPFANRSVPFVPFISLQEDQKKYRGCRQDHGFHQGHLQITIQFGIVDLESQHTDTTSKDVGSAEAGH